MRILHTSDWHLGLALHNVSMLDEQREMVRQLLNTVETEQVEAVILAGDVFDHAVANAETIGLYNDAMTAICQKAGVPVLICAGNHDGASRLASCASLLREAGLYVSGKLTGEIQPVIVGDAAIFLLPYFHIDEVRALYPQAEVKSYADAMAAVTAEMRGRFVLGKRNILAAHCFAAGAQLSESDRAAAVGGSNQVGCDVFEGFDYVALGHLHRAQNPAPNVRYSGTPLCYSFSEAGQGKSFTLLDTSDLSVREIPVRPIHGLRVIKDSYERILEQAAFDAHPDDYLKIELDDCFAGLERLELLRQYYPNLLLLTGKAEEGKDSGELTVEELTALRPKDLVCRFYAEMTGEEPDEELLGWFELAAREIEEADVQ